MLKIDIHTHIIPKNLNSITDTFSDKRYLSIKYLNNKSADLIKDDNIFRRIDCNCWNIKTRINECKNNINVQVLSTIPVLFSYWANKEESLRLSQFINDNIAQSVQEYNKYFIGLGTIPMQYPDIAIREMDRCINELKLPGIQIGSNINNDNLSDNKYLPIFEHAEKIGCSIFIHPWNMMGEKYMKKYWLPWLVSMPAETSRAICSFIFGGIFDKYPELKIAFAHGGGSFPFTIGRIDHGYKVRPDLCAIDNNNIPSKYLKYFYVDSLVHDKKIFQYLINIMSVNNIALGTDYPFPLGEHIPGNIIEKLKLSLKDKNRLYHGTALEWLGIKKEHFIE